jgi:hypothetical protein
MNRLPVDGGIFSQDLQKGSIIQSLPLQNGDVKLGVNINLSRNAPFSKNSGMIDDGFVPLQHLTANTVNNNRQNIINNESQKLILNDKAYTKDGQPVPHTGYTTYLTQDDFNYNVLMNKRPFIDNEMEYKELKKKMKYNSKELLTDSIKMEIQNENKAYQKSLFGSDNLLKQENLLNKLDTGFSKKYEKILKEGKICCTLYPAIFPDSTYQKIETRTGTYVINRDLLDGIKNNQVNVVEQSLINLQKYDKDITIFEIDFNKEIITYVSHSNTNYLSFGKKANAFQPKIFTTLSNVFKNIQGIEANKTYVFRDMLSNPHHEPASVRRFSAKEMEIKVNLENDGEVIGLGYNLLMANSWPGTYYNGIYDISDLRRVTKYRNTNLKAPQLLVDHLFTIADLNNHDGNITVKSVDVAYYLNIQEIVSHIKVKNFYATFGVYRVNADDSYPWGLYKVNNNMIFAKMSDNAFPYRHDHVNVFDQQITCDFIDTLLMEKILTFEGQNVLRVPHYSYAISFDNIIRVTPNYYYCTMVIDKLLNNLNHDVYVFTVTKHDFILTLNAGEEDMYLNDYTIIKEDEMCNNFLGDLSKWIRGFSTNTKNIYPIVSKVLSNTVYSTLINQELIIFDEYNEKKKIKVCMKIKNDIFNEISLLFRRKVISVEQIKNAANTILTQNVDCGWGLQLDYLKATYLSIIVAKYVAFCNRIIVNDFEDNKVLYENDNQEKFINKVSDKLINIGKNIDTINKIIDKVDTEFKIKDQVVDYLENELFWTKYQGINMTCHNIYIFIIYIMYFIFYWKYDRSTVLYGIKAQYKFRYGFWLDLYYKITRYGSKKETLKAVKTIAKEQILRQPKIPLYRVENILVLLSWFCFSIGVTGFTIFWIIQNYLIKDKFVYAKKYMRCADIISEGANDNEISMYVIDYIIMTNFSKHGQRNAQRLCHPDKHQESRQKYQKIMSVINKYYQLYGKILKDADVVDKEDISYDDDFTEALIGKIEQFKFSYNFEQEIKNYVGNTNTDNETFVEILDRVKNNIIMEVNNDTKTNSTGKATFSFTSAYQQYLKFLQTEISISFIYYLTISLILLVTLKAKLSNINLSALLFVLFFGYYYKIPASDILMIMSYIMVLNIKGSNFRKRFFFLVIMAIFYSILILICYIKIPYLVRSNLSAAFLMALSILNMQTKSKIINLIYNFFSIYQVMSEIKDINFNNFKRIIRNNNIQKLMIFLAKYGITNKMVIAVISFIISPITKLLYCFCYQNSTLTDSVIPTIIFGACTANNIYEIIKNIDAWTTKKNEKFKITYRNEYTKNIVKKYLKRKDVNARLRCKANPQIQYMTYKTFAFSGYYLDNNYPYKLHRCANNEMEAIYRQLRIELKPDPIILQDFKKFAEKQINQLVDEVDETDFMEYIEHYAPTVKEYMDGYQSYLEGKKLNLNYKMHCKIDEKFFINYGDTKLKSRNISAQNPMAKALMGFLTHTAMKLLHKQLWSGPGYNTKERILKFNKWVEEIPNCVCLSVDGSAFDSTQHKEILQIVDCYFMKRILQKCSKYLKYVAERDVRKVITQVDFRVGTKYCVYTIKGTQMSGRMNTCVCNTLRSHLYIQYSKYKASMLNHPFIKHEVCGDDQIIFISKHLVDRYITFARKYVYVREDAKIKYGLGQIAKIFGKYDKITGAEYLSMILIYDEQSGKIAMVRKLDRFMQLTPYTFRNDKKKLTQFYYLQNLLAIGDYQNSKEESNIPEIMKKYLEKMNKIAKLNIIKMRSSLSKLEVQRCRKIVFTEQFAHRFSNISNSTIPEDRLNELYEEYLQSEYDINKSEVEDFLEQLSKVKQISDKPQSSIVDKINHIKSYYQAYSKVKSLEKFRHDCDYTVKNGKIIFE